MNETYLRERRTDSIVLLLPGLIVLVAVPSALFMGVSEFDEILRYWSLLACVLFSPASGLLARRLLRSERQVEAGALFVLTHLVLITLVLLQMWQWPWAAFIPYVFGIFVLVSSMIVYLEASFQVWFLSCLFMFVGLWLTDQMSWAALGRLLPPVGINLVLAFATYLSAYDWQLALNSVSQVQVKAQTRRDELFDMKEELSFANAKLLHANEALEKARGEAIAERDLRTRFMNNVSHELRTPLNAIVNFANILARGGAGGVNQRQIDYLGRVERSGWHLLNVLNDLLDMAQIESGEFKLHREVTDLHALCEDALDTTRALLPDNEVALIRIYPDKWPLLSIDPIRVKQALFNLLGNAAKFTTEGFVMLRVWADADFQYVQVADSGVGIAPEHHERIFREFQQVDETVARRRVGTGLGLPITRHLVERHGGTLALESDIGAGSRFTIALPLYVAPPDGPAAASGAAVDNDWEAGVAQKPAADPPPPAEVSQNGAMAPETAAEPPLRRT